DIPNIRWIIHLQIPENIEDYYQEIGRGGRDGKPCKTVLLYAPRYDYQRRLNLLKRSFTNPTTIINIYRILQTADEGAEIPTALPNPAKAA
ncbi:MAG: hypothetical protein J7J67_01960, partial [Thermoproteales archaeon]|nr:hypothetical protein [Thermoproteales archaeon]